jgi:alpha-glucosidase
MKHRVAGIIFLLILCGGAWLLFPRALAGGSAIDFLSRAGPWGPVLFIAFYILSTVAGLPGSLLTAAGGAIFGGVAGAAWSLIGATLGAAASFLVSRHLFSDWVRRRCGGTVSRVIAGVEASGWRFVALVRLVPLVPFNAVNYALGLTRIGLAPYTLATLVCMAPGALACALLGQGGVEAARGEAQFVRTLSLGVGILAAAALLPRVWRRLSHSWRRPEMPEPGRGPSSREGARAEGPVRGPARWSLLPALVLAPIASSLLPAESPLVRVRSPGGDVSIELDLEREGAGKGIPRWRAGFKGRPIVLPSRLGFELERGAALGGPCTVESVETGSRRAEYEVFPGKRRRAADHFTEAVITLREQAPPARRWELVLRAYDDGAALRYRFPVQDGWPGLVIAAERTEIDLPADAVAFALPLNGFTTSYEKFYERKRVPEVPPDWLLGLPLLVECPGRGWAAITEANLTEFAGMYLARAGNGAATLASRLSPLPGEPGVAVEASLPHASPWRVVLLGDDPGRLVESDLVLHLNEPCAIADTSWIRPGKTTFPWWNGYHLEEVGFKPGLNTDTMKHYIDFCAESGIPYHSLDGHDGVAWYGGPIVPYRGADITKALPGIDLEGVIAHARAKGVRLRLWMHWEAARAHMDRAFPLYREWGIEGVMIDFMDRDDQEMVRFIRDLVRKAAENRLTVTLHGSPKPTGLERTYPNLLTSEGVLNLEYDKWDPAGCTPEHEVTVPFTRMLAGPLDFHQGSFRGVTVERFAPRNVAPLVMGTPGRTLASYVVYQNHLPMVADYPSAYRGHPGLEMLARIPCSWDDTRVLSGKVGEHAVIARRHGREWYIGAMNDRTPRALEVSLSFLEPGRHRAETFADGKGPARPMERRTAMVAAGDVLRIELEPAGGHLTWLAPADGPGAR